MSFHAVLALLTLGLAALLGLVCGLAAWRTKSLRFVFAALAFAGLGARALLYALGREGVVSGDLVPGSLTSLAIDAVVVALLYLAVVKE